MISVVFRTLDRDKYVAFGDAYPLPVYAVLDDGEGIILTRMSWPSCERFLVHIFIDQQESMSFSEAEILERYGGYRTENDRHLYGEEVYREKKKREAEILERFKPRPGSELFA